VSFHIYTTASSLHTFPLKNSLLDFILHILPACSADMIPPIVFLLRFFNDKYKLWTPYMYNFLQFFDELLITPVSRDSYDQIFSVAEYFPQSRNCAPHYSRNKHFAVLTGLARLGVGKLRSASSFFSIR
jgi:hypothetical protein